MNCRERKQLLVLIDAVIVSFSIFMGYYLIHPVTGVDTYPMFWVSFVTLLIGHFTFATYYGIYKNAWEYASIGELTTIVKGVTFSIAFAAIAQLIIYQDVFFRGLATTWMIYVILIGGTRFSWRVIRNQYISPNPSGKRTLIVGAGEAGTLIARQLLKNDEVDLYPVAFVDDNPRKIGLRIYGIEVMGSVTDIPRLVEKNDVENIVIAVPSLQKQEINRIYEQCAKTKAKIKIMPLIEDLVTGKISVNKIRDVQVEDLLGREPVVLDMSTISNQLTGKTVLVTGAGGSIGSEICRQVANFKPDKLLLLGHGENSIYTIDMELRENFENDIQIIPIIADVQDRERIFTIMSKYRPDVVYHAAAHKHVPLMEYNPKEAVKNNIFGTKNVAEAADKYDVKNFVLVSTDKAVNPPNVMGATKRFAEMIIQNLVKESNTKFVAVRFGNVLGSRGSVIPLFKKQIQAGGPVTVTDPEMTRYFMTIPEASRLVIQAGTLARGGEVFVLDMGEPVKIVDLAKNIITLSGYTVDEIGIKFTGMRPGEKLFEELLNDNEVQKKQVFTKIFIGKAVPMDKEELFGILEKLLEMNSFELKETLVGIANTKFVEKEAELAKSI